MATTQSNGKSQSIIVGPYGGSGGTGWDDGTYTGVRKIEFAYKDAIAAFNVTYDLNGQAFEGPKHPATHYPSFKNATIELQCPEEYLIGVSGYVGIVSWAPQRTPAIRSLTFTTNKRTFGPYGKEEGTHFNLPIEKGLIVGFKGSSGELLDAIGFRLAL